MQRKTIAERLNNDYSLKTDDDVNDLIKENPFLIQYESELNFLTKEINSIAEKQGLSPKDTIHDIITESYITNKLEPERFELIATHMPETVSQGIHYAIWNLGQKRAENSKQPNQLSEIEHVLSKGMTEMMKVFRQYEEKYECCGEEFSRWISHKTPSYGQPQYMKLNK